jgi:hypothetical protein
VAAIAAAKHRAGKLKSPGAAAAVKSGATRDPPTIPPRAPMTIESLFARASFKPATE